MATAAPNNGTRADSGALAATLKALEQSGPNTPASGLDILQRFSQAAIDEANTAQQADYYRLLAQYSMYEHRDSLFEKNISHLQKLGNKGCSYCGALVTILRADELIQNQNLKQATAQLSPLRERRGLPLAVQLRYHEVLAELYSDSGIYAPAIIEQLDVQKIARQLGGRDLAIIFSKIGLTAIYASRSNVKRARNVGIEALQAARENGSLWLRSIALLNLSYLYTNMNDWKRQEAVLKRLLQITASSSSRDVAITRMVGQNNLAIFYMAHKQTTKALRLSKAVLDESRRFHDKVDQADALMNIATIESDHGQTASAIAHAQTAVALYKQAEDLYDSAQTQSWLGQLLFGVKRYKEAAQMFRGAIAAQHEASSKQSEQVMAAVRERYQSELWHKEVSRLQADNARRRVEVDNYRILMWLAVACVMIVLLLVIIVTQQSLRVRSRNRELADINKRLATQSFQDALTGAGNRRFLEEWMARRRLRSRTKTSRHYVPANTLGFFLFDLDRFKHVNDEHGHEVGDTVLVEVVRRLRQSLRKDDTIVRWGGEELVLIFPGLQQNELESTTQRLLSAVRSAPVKTPSQDIRVTVSGGAIILSRADHDWHRAFRIADHALYAAKRAGRDCCVISLSPSAVLDEESTVALLESSDYQSSENFVLLKGSSSASALD